MKVTVKLFATLTHYAPGVGSGRPFQVELASEATLQELIEQLKIPLGETRVTFVNGLIQEPDHRLAEGDEVGIFPPIGGG